MNLKPLTIPAVMAITFSLACGVLLWNEGARDGDRAAPLGRQRLPAPDQRVGQPPRSDFQPSAPPAAVQPTPPPGDEGDNAADLSQTEIPVTVLSRRTAPESGPVATLTNLSARALKVDVTAANAATGKQAFLQLVLAAHEHKDLSGAGLEIEKGDQVTVHGPPYRDREVQIQ